MHNKFEKDINGMLNQPLFKLSRPQGQIMDVK